MYAGSNRRAVGFPRDLVPGSSNHIPTWYGNWRTQNNGRQRQFGGPPGDQYGLGREGRARVEPPLARREQPDLMGGRFGGLGSPHLGGEGFLRSPVRNAFDRRPPPLGRRGALFDDALADLQPPCPRLGHDMGYGKSPLGRGGFAPAALDAFDFEPGSPFLYSPASECGLRQLDRLARPYNYQSPYVEDYESDIEEELRREEIELALRYPALARDFYDDYGVAEGLGDLRRRRGLR